MVLTRSAVSHPTYGRDHLPRRGQLAWDLVQAGQPVFPCCYPDANGGCGCGEHHQGRDIGKAPIGRVVHRGKNDATKITLGVCEYWGQRGDPNANIGIALPENEVALDVDANSGGLESMRKFVDDHGPFPITRVHLTGSTDEYGNRGQHIIFKNSSEVPVPQSKLAGYPGLELRVGGKGYIMAPGSLHVTGRTYEVLNDVPWDQLAELPKSIIDIANSEKGHTKLIGEPTPDGVRIIPLGQRDIDVTSLIGSMRSRGMAEEAITAAMLEVNRLQVRPPWADADIIEKVRSICHRYEPGELPGQHYHLTDIGNAERLAARHGKDIRFCVMEKTWYVWTGKLWKADRGLILMRTLAKDTARHIYEEVANEKDDDKAKAIAGHATRSESSRAIDAMISLAEAELGVAVQPDDFDKDVWLLNCRNGTLNLKTGLLQAHDRSDLLTKITPVDFDPTAVSEEWERFLMRTFGDDQELIAFVQRALGYSVTGNTSERALFFCHGGGSNGKTQLLEAVSRTIGKGVYATETGPSTFMLKKDQSQGTINEPIAKLRNINLVTATETEQSQRLAVALLKRATGGEDLWHEVKFEHGYPFKPRFSLWLSGNIEPSISDNTDSIWDRLYKIPFNNRVPKEERILEYGRILAEKYASAILTWLVKGCLEWQKQGLKPPKLVTDATAIYRERQDVIGEFVLETLFDQSSQAKITVTDMYKAYKSWAEENGCHCLGKEAFNEKLEQGYKFRKARGAKNKMTWYGVRLKTPEERLLVTSSTSEVTQETGTFIHEGNAKETIQISGNPGNPIGTNQIGLLLPKEGLLPENEEVTCNPSCPLCAGDSTEQYERFKCMACGGEFDSNGNLVPKGE